MPENADHLLTNKELRTGFLGLYFGRLLAAISTGLLGIFLPIFLYNIFDGNMNLVMLYYASSCFVYLLIVAFGAQFLNRFGFRKALIIASFAAAAINISYYFTTKENMGTLIPLSLFFLIIYRMLFWIPYNVDFAIFTNGGRRGGQVGLLLSTITLLGVAGPMIAGYVIETWSIQILFFVAVAVYALGALPFAFVPRTNERFSWSYARSWRELFSKKNRGVVLASIANGAEDMIGTVIWPIFIFLLLKGDYFRVGALSSFIVGITVLMQYMFGHYLDKMGKKDNALKTGSILYAIGWVIKIFVATAFQVFVVGLYHKVTKVLTDTSFDTIFFEAAADQGHYVDEFTVLGEMAVQIGKIAAAGGVVVIALYMSLKWAFIIGAIASLAFTTLSSAREQRII